MAETINRDEYLSHITDFEQIKNMKRVLDLIEIVIRDYSIQSTDFLDPYSIRLAESILNRFDSIAYTVFGGFKEAERKIVIIYPDYHYLIEDEIPLTPLRLKGDLSDLNHRDFLGAILGQGITRSKLGDILVAKESVDIVVKEEVKNFILVNLKKIGNKNFSIEEIKFSHIQYVEDEYETINTTISSLRLDVYISSAYNLSRKDSQNIITSKRAKVNFEPISKVSYELVEGDLVSLRGYGRSRLYRVVGLSKKNRLKVEIRKLK